MNVAELAVKIGLTGGVKTAKELQGVQGGMAGAVSKGMLLAETIKFIAEGLADMVAKSGRTGSSLANFSRLTGLSVKELQRYQYAGRQMLITNEEMTGSIMALQDAVHKQQTNQGTISGLGEVAGTVEIDATRMKDTYYMMQQLQKYAQAMKNDPVRVKDVLSSFGLSEKVISGMLRNQFTEKNMKGASVYSDSEVKKLEKINAAWANLGDKIEKIVGRLNAKFGTETIKFVRELADNVEDLIVAMMEFVKQFKIFELINTSIEGWKMLLEGATEIKEDAKTWKSPKDQIEQGGFFEFLKKDFRAAFGIDSGKSTFSPGAIAKNPNNVTVNQNLNFQHEGKNADELSRSQVTAAHRAFGEIKTVTQEK